MHIRLEQEIIDGSDVAIALRCAAVRLHRQGVTRLLNL